MKTKLEKLNKMKNEQNFQKETRYFESPAIKYKIVQYAPKFCIAYATFKDSGNKAQIKIYRDIQYCEDALCQAHDILTVEKIRMN